MIMSQDSNYNQLKGILLKIKNNIAYFYNNYIKIPCINIISYCSNYFFVSDNIELVKDISQNNTHIQSEVELCDTIPSEPVEEEPSITKRVSYSDNNSNEFQEISIHRQSISMYINHDYINKSE
jgi:hypothetical protein